MNTTGFPRVSSYRPMRAFLALCLFWLMLLTSCKGEETKKEPEKVVNVKTVKAEMKSLRPFIEAVGSLNAYEEVTVSAEIDGILKEMRVDNGTPVAKGVVLAAIDEVDYALEARRAEAALRQTEATLANTRVEFKRKESLLKEELLTRQQFDDVSTRLSLAEAEVERAKASLSLAQQRFSKTKIYSPLTGVVKEKKAERGNFVKNGTPLFSLIQNNPIKLNFAVAEKDIGRLRIGQEVTFFADALPGREFKGKVTIVYPSLDEKTRTLQVEAQVPNSDGLLKPGLFAKAVLFTGPPQDKVVVPVIAPLYERDQVKIFVVEGDHAVERQAQLGLKQGELIEVNQGVKGGETVVVAGQQNLADGVKVRAQSDSQQSAVGSPESKPKEN